VSAKQSPRAAAGGQKAADGLRASMAAPQPADLAAECRACSAVAGPWFVIPFGAGIAAAFYRCACGRRWGQRWADDATAEGAAALAAAPGDGMR